MTCERYWREGIVLVERGDADPHRDSCPDCTRAHAARQELIDSLPLVGGGYTGDPRWQAGVWRRIQAEQAPAPRAWPWKLTSGLSVAAAVVMVALGLFHGGGAEPRPSFEFISGPVAMRSRADHHVDDRLRVAVGGASEVRIYRGDKLVLRCGPRESKPGCTPDDRGMIVERTLDVPGGYEVLVFEATAALPAVGYDTDYGALDKAGIHPTEQKFTVD
jgi:hypothetical protein